MEACEVFRYEYVDSNGNFETFHPQFLFTRVLQCLYKFCNCVHDISCQLRYQMTGNWTYN